MGQDRVFWDHDLYSFSLILSYEWDTFVDSVQCTLAWNWSKHFMWNCAGLLGSRAAKAIGFIDDMINDSCASAPLQQELKSGKSSSCYVTSLFKLLVLVPDLQKIELIWMGDFVFFLEKGETQTLHSPEGYSFHIFLHDKCTNWCQLSWVINILAGANGKAGRVRKLGYEFNQNCVHSSA